jgi:hypothetical protein
MKILQVQNMSPSQFLILIAALVASFSFASPAKAGGPTNETQEGFQIQDSSSTVIEHRENGWTYESTSKEKDSWSSMTSTIDGKEYEVLFNHITYVTDTYVNGRLVKTYDAITGRLTVFNYSPKSDNEANIHEETMTQEVYLNGVLQLNP